MRYLWIAFVIACGGSGGDTKPDAFEQLDAPEVDAPAGPGGCNFTETADTTNNTSASAEATMLTFAGTKTTICGKVNNGHFNAANGAVDIDTFKVTLSADADILVHLTGTITTTRAILQVGTTAGMQRNLGVYEGDHGTLSVRLTAGEYVFAATALNAADIAAPIDYKLTIVADTPATRCAKVTAATNFTEAGDGAGNNGNDMLRVDESANPPVSLTPGADNPEATNLTLAAGTNYRLTGASANVNPNDSYMDRDTFLVTTGATTTQLSVRLNWTSTATDFDFKYLPAGSVLSVSGGLLTSNTEDEFQTFAVKPSTQYWLWVGAYDGSTAAGYDATLCAEAFAP